MGGKIRTKLPRGIDINNTGTLRLRIKQKGVTVFTLAQGEPYSQSDVAYLVGLQKTVKEKLARGESIEEYKRGHKAETSKATSKPFWQAAQIYLDQCDISKTTRDEYVRDLNKCWIPYLGEKLVNQITRNQIFDILYSKVALTNPHTNRKCKPLSKLSGKTKENLLTVLRNVLKHEGVANIADDIHFDSGQAAKRERYKPNERDAIIFALKPGIERAWYALAFGIGLRPSESLGLMWSDFNDDYTRVDIERAVVRGIVKSTKNSKRRVVIIPDWVRPYINTIEKNSVYVFGHEANSFRSKTKRFNAAWIAAHESTGIRYRQPYTCRHTRAAELLSVGISSHKAARQLGHSFEMFEQVYSEFIEEYCNDLSAFNTAGPKPVSAIKGIKKNKN